NHCPARRSLTSGVRQLMITYKFICNEVHLIDSVKHHRRLGAKKYLRIAIKSFCILTMLALLAICLQSPYKWTTLVPVVAVILVFLGPQIDYWFYARRYKKSPEYGLTAEITFADDGVSFVTSKSNSTLAWSYFTQVRRMSDGFIVFYGPSNYAWWPDKAIAFGTVDDLCQLLASKTVDYKNA
ncbi:MAG: YcxB family protein, partial [Arenimonas sp.]